MCIKGIKGKKNQKNPNLGGKLYNEECKLFFATLLTACFKHGISTAFFKE